MAALCNVALERAATKYVDYPESDYVKVTKENWDILSFALGQQEDLARALAKTFFGEEVSG